MWIFGRTFDPATREYRRSEFVGYVDTGKTLSGLAALDAHAGPPAAIANPVRSQFRPVQDLREFRAWRRYQRAYSQVQTYDHFGLDG
jgi:hypothetical protein